MSFRPKKVFRRLYAFFGPQHWWPADGPFEVAVGAILTQNTSWSNVERAIVNLKKKNALEPKKLLRMPSSRLAALIRPAGYYNLKVGRLKSFLHFFFDSYSGEIKKISRVRADKLRKELLCVKGIGPETADSILLYALNKPVFVVDAYTRRILERHGIGNRIGYDEAQLFFTRRLRKSAPLFNEYHALLVRVGKDFCRKSKPDCALCPLGPIKKG